MDTEVPLAERDRADPAPGRDERSRFGVRTQRYALLVVACAAVIAAVNTFVAQPYEIPSGSMENTLRSGDRVLVDKLAYRFGGAPARGDVVVFDGEGSFVQESGRTGYVKRVIGIGGDRVTCCDRRGRITVNGRPLDETYLYPGDTPSRVAFDIEVPEGRLWVMGDHRADSRDSRDHLGDPGGGTVPVDKVIGRAEFTIWPLSRRRSLDGAHG
ncbi:signal peptidase I [Streptomyces sp. NPDC046977]|uniref:signal peptidase I n=1 Tax=Streptomyces sp. NPDC046977 TaxID=3154703 RepID=UPI0033C49830